MSFSIEVYVLMWYVQMPLHLASNNYLDLLYLIYNFSHYIVSLFISLYSQGVISVGNRCILAFSSLYFIGISWALFHTKFLCIKRLLILPQSVAINLSALSKGTRLLNFKHMNLSLKGPFSLQLWTGSFFLVTTGTCLFLFKSLPYLVSNLHSSPSSTRNKVLLDEAIKAWPTPELTLSSSTTFHS